MKQIGFTLVELMITILVLAIAAGFALPSFQSLILRNSVVANSNQLVGALNFARTEATKRGGGVYAATLNDATAGNEWGSGYVVFADADADATYDAGEELRFFEAMPQNVTLSSATDSVRFLGTGLAADTLSLALCSSDGNIDGQTISVSLSGRVTSATLNCP